MVMAGYAMERLTIFSTDIRRKVPNRAMNSGSPVLFIRRADTHSLHFLLSSTMPTSMWWGSCLSCRSPASISGGSAGGLKTSYNLWVGHICEYLTIMVQRKQLAQEVVDHVGWCVDGMLKFTKIVSNKPTLVSELLDLYLAEPHQGAVAWVWLGVMFRMLPWCNQRLVALAGCCPWCLVWRRKAYCFSCRWTFVE